MMIDQLFRSCAAALVFGCFVGGPVSVVWAEDKSAEIGELEMRAVAGSAEDQYQLGIAVLRGEGITANPTRARQLFEQAAEQGHIKAQYNFGAMLLNGQGGPEDITAGIEWVRKSAEAGADLAQFAYGRALQRGIGVDRDPEQALVWFQKSAEAGNVRAQALLGSRFFHGDDEDPADYEVAAKWLAMAAEQGDAVSQNTLAYMNEMGMGVERNANRAFELARAAAEQGDAKAQSKLGRYYREGVGVERDHVEAYRWLTLSFEQGEVTAEKVLETVLPVLSPEEIERGQQLIAEYRKSRRGPASESKAAGDDAAKRGILPK